MVESTNDSRMEERNQSETGRHGRIEGGERTAVEALLEMAKFYYNVEEMDDRAVTLEVELCGGL